MCSTLASGRSFKARRKLDLVAPGKVFLHAGKMSSEIMRPEARGFEVQTPKGSVVDLGTEFAVDVTPSEDVQVHVFKGEVVVEQPAKARWRLPPGQQCWSTRASEWKAAFQLPGL